MGDSKWSVISYRYGVSMELGSFVIISGLIGGVVYKLSGFARSGFALLKRYCVTTIEINSQANLYYKFDSYITEKIKKNRIIELHSEETPQLLGSGLHYFFLKGTLCLLYKSIKTDNPNGGVIKTLYLTIFTRKLDKINKIIDEVIAYGSHNKNYLELQHSQGHAYDAIWGEPIKIQKRTLDSIVIDKNTKNSFIQDFKDFLSKKTLYESLGIVWKRGYCLHSLPGMGKSSLIRAIASEHDLKIFSLDLSSIPSDSVLKNLITNLNKYRTTEAYGSSISWTDRKLQLAPVNLLIIEDIDTMFCGRENKIKDSQLTFSGLLNVLDGLSSASGIITIITTNHLEKLDPALIRSGRIDKIIELLPPTDDLIKEMIKRFIDNLGEQQIVFNEIKSEGLSSMAQIQDKLIKKIM